MIRFQMDECLNSRRLCRECNEAGKSEVKRFPTAQKGAQDPQVLAQFATRITLVTSDMAILEEHHSAIPVINKGLVVLGNSPEILRTATERDYRSIITRFKSSCPTWNSCDFSNSLVVITEKYAQVFHVDLSRVLIRDGFFDFSDPSWAESFVAILEANAKHA